MAKNTDFNTTSWFDDPDDGDSNRVSALQGAAKKNVPRQKFDFLSNG